MNFPESVIPNLTSNDVIMFTGPERLFYFNYMIIKEFWFSVFLLFYINLSILLIIKTHCGKVSLWISKSSSELYTNKKANGIGYEAFIYWLQSIAPNIRISSQRFQGFFIIILISRTAETAKTARSAILHNTFKNEDYSFWKI